MKTPIFLLLGVAFMILSSVSTVYWIDQPEYAWKDNAPGWAGIFFILGIASFLFALS